MTMTKRVQDRISVALKALRPTIEQQRSKDVSEADTVTVVKDIMASAFGYDKYVELTSEHAIRGTYCDIAVEVDGKVWALIEVKSAGTTLDDRHVKQAIDYASNKGVEWCMLTNGCEWRLYHVVFAKPIDKQLIAQVDLLTVNFRSEEHLLKLYAFSKEGFAKGAHIEARDRINATSKHLVAALLLHNEDVCTIIRRELRKLVDVKVEPEDLLPVLESQVIKRDCLDGPEAQAALSKVTRGRRGRSKETPAPAPSSGSETKPET